MTLKTLTEPICDNLGICVQIPSVCEKRYKNIIINTTFYHAEEDSE